MERAPREILPLFAIPMVMFPGESAGLHIFEERYKQMLEHCTVGGLEAKERHFGVNYRSEEEMQPTGCAVRIEQIVRTYEDGRSDIVVHGVRRYRVLKAVAEDPFPTAEVQYITDEEEKLELTLRERAVALHRRHDELKRGMTPHYEFPSHMPLSFTLAIRSALEPIQRQRLLEMVSENQRLLALVEFYRSAISTIMEEEAIKTTIGSNGHFKK